MTAYLFVPQRDDRIPSYVIDKKSKKMKNINSALTKKVVGSIYDDLAKYYGLYAFVKYKIKAIQEKPLLIKSIPEFWSMILEKLYLQPENYNGPSIRSGQIVNFDKHFYLSEWAPKTPGKLWTSYGNKSLIEAKNHEIEDSEWKWKKKFDVVFDEYGKKKSIEGGLGSVRINPSGNPDESFMYMSISHIDNWTTDEGIPVIVSKSVFEEYRSKSIDGGAVEIEKLEGFLIRDLDLPVSEIISKAIGADLPESSKDILLNSIRLPKCFIYVPSKLNVSFKHNRTHPKATAWTMYKRETTEEWMKNFGQKVNYEFGLTYTQFNPTDESSIKQAIEFLHEYAEYNNGSSLITDFDGMERKLNSKLTISETTESQTANFREVVTEMNTWVQSM